MMNEEDVKSACNTIDSMMSAGALSPKQTRELKSIVKNQNIYRQSKLYRRITLFLLLVIPICFGMSCDKMETYYSNGILRHNPTGLSIGFLFAAIILIALAIFFSSEFSSLEQCLYKQRHSDNNQDF